MTKIIFMDIDGTLVNDHGIVPNSAKRAIEIARDNGHLVFICTGRSKAELFEDILAIGFDGIIGAAGGYVEAGEEILFHETVKTEDIQHIVDYFNQHSIDFYLESNGGLFASAHCKNHIRSIIEQFIADNPRAKEEVERGMNPFHESLIEGENLIRNDVNKISFLGSTVPIKDIQHTFGTTFTVTPGTVSAFGENSGELSLPGIHKATAIAKLLDHLGIEQEQTYAYGDGLNDLEMIAFVKCGIAMGNAKEALKQAADDVTDTHDNDGIYNSFKKYGLI